MPGFEDATVEDVEEGPKMPNLGGLDIGDMLNNVDVNSIMENMDLGAMGDMMKGMSTTSTNPHKYNKKQYTMHCRT